MNYSSRKTLQTNVSWFKPATRPPYELIQTRQ